MLEIDWGRWRDLYPATLVVSDQTGHDRNYQVYPYRDYERELEDVLLDPMPVDDRRPPKELVLGVAQDGRPIAFSFGELDDGSSVRVVEPEMDSSIVVFWDGEGRAAATYHSDVGRNLSFHPRDGRIVDRLTGSTWRVDGCAATGPLRSSCLQAVDDVRCLLVRLGCIRAGYGSLARRR